MNTRETTKNKQHRLVTGTSGLPARVMLALLVITLFILPAVSATTYITFSPMGVDTEDILIHNSTGSLIGRYNTSSAAIALDDNSSYVMLIVPSNENLMGNHPDVWFAGFVSYVRNNAVSFVLILFCIGILIAARRRR